MQIHDKELRRKISVAAIDCPKKQCYWPRPDPGSFTQGKGYKFRSNDWLCGTREANGCPVNPVDKEI
jgi:hypothetical protein